MKSSSVHSSAQRVCISAQGGGRVARVSGAGIRRRAACVVHSRRRRGAGAGNLFRLLLGLGTSTPRRCGAILLWWDYQMQRAELSDIKCDSSENYANQELARLELGQEFPRKGNT